MEELNEVQLDTHEVVSPVGETLPVKKKRAGLWIGLGVCLVVVLAAAAYVGGQLLNRTVDGSVNPVIMLGSDGEGGMSSASVSAQVEMEPAPELPKTAPEISGVMSRMEDNRIYLRSLNKRGSLTAAQGPDGKLTFPDNQLGPEVEVVVTKETLIYHDVTDFTAMVESDGGPAAQQKLEEISIDEISDQGMFVVWGRREGDRVIADIIIYMGM